MKNFRADILIAVCALLVSGFATVASWWQTRVVAQQLSAQVWPYVNVGLTYGPKQIIISADNDGLGPAVVRWLVFTVDGRPKRSFAEVQRALAPGSRGRSSWISELARGSVIKVGGSVQLLRVEDPALLRPLEHGLPRLDVQTCYCSILSNCWIASIRNAEPRAVQTCPDRANDEFHVPIG